MNAEEGLLGVGHSLVPTIGALVGGSIAIAIEQTPANLPVGIGVIVGMVGATLIADRLLGRPLRRRQPEPHLSTRQWIGLYVAVVLVGATVETVFPSRDFLSWAPSGEAL